MSHLTERAGEVPQAPLRASERKKSAPTPRSVTTIAKLLGADGYTDFVHNQVEKYWRARHVNVAQVRSDKAHLDKLERAFSKLMKNFGDADRKTVGAFISARSHMSFDTGLRLGLQASIYGLETEEFDED